MDWLHEKEAILKLQWSGFGKLYFGQGIEMSPAFVISIIKGVFKGDSILTVKRNHEGHAGVAKQ